MGNESPQNCRFTPRLGALLDNELAPDAAAEVQAHLQNCPVCAAEWRELQELQHTIRHMPRPAMASDSQRRLHANFDASLNRRRLERFIGRLTAAAACVALLGGIWNFYSHSEAVAPTAWEQAALKLGEDPNANGGANTELATAQWVVSDLSVRSTAP